MDKTRFISLLHHYSGSSAEEAENLISLKSQYPYSQLLHTLAARVTKDHGLDNHQQALQMAAIHAADRSVLKEIISSDAHQATVSQIAAGDDSKPERAIASETVVRQETKSSTIRSIDSEDVADEIMRDLEKLNTLRHNFEMLFVEYSEVSITSPGAEEPAKNTGGTQKEQKEDDPLPKDKTKSKKQRIIELARAKNAAGTSDENREDVTPAKTKKGKAVRQPDELIEEIQSTKQEISPENDKQKEQIELINQFIKAQPSITNAKERQAIPSGDLNPIKSGEFGDNIVSETLVEILVKQGKKDKAIEVLKKLIWKYPQKKAYFASQIEDLKK